MKPDRIERATLLLLALVVGFQLFVPPVVGLANNGDFHKVIAWFSLAGPVADEYKYATQTLTYHPDNFLVFGFASSEQLLAAASIALNTLFSKTGAYDLRFIGLLHAALYLGALWLLLPLLHGMSPRRRIVVGALAALVFGDVMYVCQFNSFYMDTPALLFFLLSAVLACRVLCWRRRLDAWGLLLCLTGMATSKSQHAPLGLLAAGLLAWRPSLFLPGFNKLARAAAVGTVALASIAVFQFTPHGYRATALFSEIFYRVLPLAREPGRELRILGLDESYKQYVGMYAYQPGSPMTDDQFVRDFEAKVSYGKLGILFLRRPGRAYDVLRLGLAEAGRQRPLLGNFDRGAGLWDSAESRAFAYWSSAKAKAFEGRGALFLGYTVALAAAFPGLIWLRRRNLPAGSLEAALAMSAALFISLTISIFGDALDCVRHSWVFFGIADAMLLAFAILV